MRTLFSKRLHDRLLILFIVGLLLSFCRSLQAEGRTGLPLSEKYQGQSVQMADQYEPFRDELFYSSIFQAYEEKGYRPVQNENIILTPALDITTNKPSVPMEPYIGDRKEPVLVWKDDQQWFEWSFEIQQDGLYEITIEYYALPGSGGPVERGLMINGEVPFSEAYNVVFPRMWTDAGAPKINSIGDEVRPRQIEVPGWRTQVLRDNQGKYAEPFRFYFAKGQHSLRLLYVDQPMAVGRVAITSPVVIPNYAEVLQQYDAMGHQSAVDTIMFQAEDTVVLKSDPTIRRESNGDPMTVPVSKGSRVLNVVGDWRWRKGNQSITWEFSVPKDGLYKVGMRLGQWWGDGLPVYRQISINGKVPFEEMMAVKFQYDRNWRMETLEDSEGEPYLFYLTEGRHALTMTVMLGPLTEVVHSIHGDAQLLSSLIRQIIMITGNNPDIHYDYELQNCIPDLMDTLAFLSTRMQEKVDILTALSVKRPAIANNFLLIKDQLDAMRRNPFTIPRKLNDLENALTSLGSWYLSLQDQPLVIDYFNVGDPDDHWSSPRSNMFQKLSFTWHNFVRSFIRDYDAVGSVYVQEQDELTTINVWVARGMEWAEVMKEMADESFTPHSGVYVNMNVLPASQLEAGAVNALMLAVTSGKAPDVAVGVGAASPVEYAIREAVVDLAKFEDAEEIIERFIPGGIIPYRYENGLYALPETMDFRALFYRVDILDELGLGIPDTWDALYSHTLPALYQNGLQFFYPPDYTPFLFQHGGSFYNDAGTHSGLDTPEAYQAFKEFTELYTSYGIPEVANFFNRMRTGEMPMGIANYPMYVHLSVAAPELAGRWAIAPVPGKIGQDGVVDRTVGGIASQACIILEQSKQQEAAWEFIKWWTSTDIQTQFGRELEALIGVEARWNTANIEAFNRLPWNRRDLAVIQEQLLWARDMPVVLGGYFTGRHINNAWNRTVLGDMMVRDSLEKAVKDINVELRSKQEEYGRGFSRDDAR